MSFSKKDINSWQIAKIAGVSRSTVSRVINDYPNVPEKTREKVMEVIRKYNYYPNISAQVLKGRKTQTIGLFWVSNDHIADDFLSNYFIVSVIENASLHGYIVLTCVVPNLSDPENIKTVKEIFCQGRIDGGIFIGCSNYEPLLEELIAEEYVIGVLDQNLPGRREPNRVIVNFDENTAQKAVDYLAGLNHRKIGMIHGDIKRYNGLQKHDSFIKGFKKNGLELVKDWTEYSAFSEKGGYRSMKAILERSAILPTAVCCANDSIAFGAMDAIHEFGLKIPEDISVIGIDDHMRSVACNPPLTTFRVDFSQMMSALTNNVIRAIKQEEENDFSCTQFGSELVERKSCRRI
jgi:LacI family transcriptional regulator